MKGVRRDFVTGGWRGWSMVIQRATRMRKGGARRLAESGATAGKSWR